MIIHSSLSSAWNGKHSKRQCEKGHNGETQHIFQYGIVSLRQTQLWCVCGKEPEDLRPS